MLRQQRLIRRTRPPTRLRESKFARNRRIIHRKTKVRRLLDKRKKREKVRFHFLFTTQCTQEEIENRRRQTRKTNKMTLELLFNEYDLTAVVRKTNQDSTFYAQSLQVPLQAVLHTNRVEKRFLINAGEFDKNHVEIDPSECENRTFFYLNGLVRALIKVRLTFPKLKALRIKTTSKYLQDNLNIKRLAGWKKRGFRSHQGANIKHRHLWESVWAIMRFVDLTVERD